jgi:hypothetical protein
MICGIRRSLNRCRSVFSLVPNMAKHSNTEHIEMMEAIERRRDIPMALEILHKHKHYSRVQLLEALGKTALQNSRN